MKTFEQWPDPHTGEPLYGLIENDRDYHDPGDEDCGSNGDAEKPNVTRRRGEADGRNCHPLAEVSVEYLRGYAAGLEKRQ